jgi:hypothetical protein
MDALNKEDGALDLSQIGLGRCLHAETADEEET